jgi:hypothetical protein
MTTFCIAVYESYLSTANSKQIFPEMKLRGLVPNFHIHVSGSDLYNPHDKSYL